MLGSSCLGTWWGGGQWVARSASPCPRQWRRRLRHSHPPRGTSPKTGAVLPPPLCTGSQLVWTLTFGVLVTQSGCAHVAETQGALAAAVDKEVAVVGVKLRRRDHFREVLHIGWLDVHDVWPIKERAEKAGHPRCSAFPPTLRLSHISIREIPGQSPRRSLSYRPACPTAHGLPPLDAIHCPCSLPTRPMPSPQPAPTSFPASLPPPTPGAEEKARSIWWPSTCGAPGEQFQFSLSLMLSLNLGLSVQGVPPTGTHCPFVHGIKTLLWGKCSLPFWVLCPHLCLPVHVQSPGGLSTWPPRKCRHRDSRLETQDMLGAAMSSLLGWVLCRRGACLCCWDKGNLEPTTGADTPKDGAEEKTQKCSLNPESGCAGSHEPCTIKHGSQ